MFRTDIIHKYCSAVHSEEAEVVEEPTDENDEDDLGDDTGVFGYAKLMKEKERQKLVS